MKGVAAVLLQIQREAQPPDQLGLTLPRTFDNGPADKGVFREPSSMLGRAMTALMHPVTIARAYLLNSRRR